MSVIGPRPALWNQDVLIAEREKYHANDVKPGLTGWAQINGRDELEIPVKAKLDGEYVEKESLLFDIKCFLGTIGSVLSSDGVVEGGTGELTKSKLAGEELFFEYGKECGAKVLVYRFPNLFGKWCRPNYNSAVATFCNNIAKMSVFRKRQTAVL